VSEKINPNIPERQIVWRDSYGIHPDEKPLIEDRIRYITNGHLELESMPRRMLLLAWEIGFEFIELKENTVYGGKWTDFCQDMFPEISSRNIERYMQLARGKDWLLKKYENDTRVGLEELPPIRQALADLQEHNRAEREKEGKPPIQHRPKEKRGRREADTTVTPVSLSDQPAKSSLPVAAENEYYVSRTMLERLCPSCRAILTQTDAVA
jgi:hypothetical protein